MISDFLNAVKSIISSFFICKHAAALEIKKVTVIKKSYILLEIKRESR